MTTQAQFAVNQSVIVTSVNDEALLLNIETGLYFGVDLVGKRIWELLSEGLTEAAIVSVLLGEYDVQDEDLRSDVRHFVDTLTAKGLVHEVRAC